MNSTTYDSIGSNYNQNRTADHRVLMVIEELLELPLGSVIADVGAGTGNYSNALADLVPVIFIMDEHTYCKYNLR